MDTTVPRRPLLVAVGAFVVVAGFAMIVAWGLWLAGAALPAALLIGLAAGAFPLLMLRPQQA